MAYKLYGDRGSGSAIIEAALAEIGAEVELVGVELGREAQRADAYAAVNPQRKLPALRTPDGETLTESAAIAITLADRHPGAELLPRDARARAQALRWLLFVATELYPVVEIIDYPDRFTEKPGDPLATRERAREIWKRRLSLLEEAVAGEPWLLAGGFSVADIYIAVVSRWAGLAEWRADNTPKIEALAAGVAERPAIAPVWARHFR